MKIRTGPKVYPRVPWWHRWTAAKQREFLETRIASLNKTNERLYKRWMDAERRVKELEKALEKK